MTLRPPHHELRHSVLARLAAHTDDITWDGEPLAYADSVIEWADWLAGCTPAPPPTAGPGSTQAGREAAKAIWNEHRPQRERY